MNFFRSSLIALCLAPLALQAQTIQGGVHGGLNLPVGDLGRALDSRFGFTIGGQVGIYYGGGHELRPRLDCTFYEGGWQREGDSFSKNKVSNWSLGADYLFYVDARPVGLYISGGLAMQWWAVAPEARRDENSSALGVSLGAGYRMNRNLAFEGRFTTGQFRSNNGQANALQALVTYRF